MPGDTGSEKSQPPAEQPQTNGVDGTMRGLRDIAGRLRLGKRGNKAKRGSTPRTSIIDDPVKSPHISSSASSRSVSNAGTSLANLSDRLRRLQEEGQESNQPFRIKFVNNRGDATMADVYPYEEFNDIIHRITAKLRMTRHADYVLLYKDTDDEEIGVACTDNLREMFSIFEPGSRLQLRIVPFKINNSGALDSIAKIWEYSHTPNVFLSQEEEMSGSETSSQDVNLSEIKLATEQKPEMAERPKQDEQPPKNEHMAVEDIADTAVQAAAASAAHVADAATANTTDYGPSSTKPEPPTSASSKTSSKKSSRKSSKVSSKSSSAKPTEPGTPANAGGKDNDELRQAIMLMSANLSLAIDSLGNKLTRNFDKLSDEQAKILETLNAAAEKQKAEEGKQHVEVDVKNEVEVDVEVDKKEDKEEIKEEIKEETKTETKEEAKEETKEEATTETKTEIKTETKTETKVEGDVETKVEESKTTTTTTSKPEADAEKAKEETKEEAKEETKEETIDIKVEEKTDTVQETVEVKAEEKTEEKTEETVKVKVEETAEKEEVVHVEVVEDTPPPPPEPSTEKIKVTVEEKYPQAEAFKFHFAAANFAFHSNPYASSFFQHGFRETGMPGHFKQPCLMSSPFECSHGCCCHHDSCSHNISTL
ncbi:hypothetical protein EV183_001581 [Coemansia sp. RSA 2336]|nr:hypothetical protein EV183_001581 [Coemansia sp. RSA 2336]